MGLLVLLFEYVSYEIHLKKYSFLNSPESQRLMITCQKRCIESQKKIPLCEFMQKTFVLFVSVCTWYTKFYNKKGTLILSN